MIALIQRRALSSSTHILYGQENVEIGECITIGSKYIYSNSNLNTLFYTQIYANESEIQMTPQNLTSNPT